MRPSEAESQAAGAREPGRPELSYDAFGRLVLGLPGGERFVGVVPVRCFQFTAPSEWISFCDARGVEVYCLRALSELDVSARALLEENLKAREFLPRIQRILSVSPGVVPTHWHVETDRGETRFTLASEDDVRRLGAAGAIITDQHGVRFRIESTRTLDKPSRKILGRYL